MVRKSSTTNDKSMQHFFGGFLVVAIALVFGLVIYPKIAFNKDGEVVPPSAPHLTSVTEHTEDGEGTYAFYAAWTAPENDGGSSITGYNIYYKIEDKTYSYNIERAETTSVVVSDIASPGNYRVWVTAINDSGEGSISNDIVVTFVDDNKDEIDFDGDVSVSVTDTTMTIDWGTTKVASSTVYYGLAEDFSAATEEYNTDPGVVSHTVTVTGLVPCTQYWAKATSYDGKNYIESTGGEFKTTGCKGGSSIVTVANGIVIPDVGASIKTTAVSGRKIEVDAPAEVKGDKEIAITALKLEKSNVSKELQPPTNKVFAGDNIYSLKAFDENITEVSKELEKDVVVKIFYTDEDVTGLDMNTLRIGHYIDGVGWEILENCTNNYGSGAGTITCLTPSFSIFALVGQQQSSGGNGGNNNNQSSSSGVVGSYVKSPATIAVVSTAPVTTSDDTLLPAETFSKNLYVGITDPDVKRLQEFLNKNGFILSIDGLGAPGNETDFYGPRTEGAVKRFQEAHKTEILVPNGLNHGTGFFGENTRKFLNDFINAN